MYWTGLPDNSIALFHHNTTLILPGPVTNICLRKLDRLCLSLIYTMTWYLFSVKRVSIPNIIDQTPYWFIIRKIQMFSDRRFINYLHVSSTTTRKCDISSHTTLTSKEITDLYIYSYLRYFICYPKRGMKAEFSPLTGRFLACWLQQRQQLSERLVIPRLGNCQAEVKQLVGDCNCIKF